MASAGPISQQAPSTDGVERISEAADLARAQAAETERERALSGELVDAIRATGLFRAGAPESIGALESAPGSALAGAERIAQGDAAAGWCVSIAMTSSLLAGWMPAEAAAASFGASDDIAAGVWAPLGKAEPTDGGFRVSGRWPFCSGISHSNWFFGGCMVSDGEGPPSLRVAGIPVEELEIIDTWHTSGLRGTGSHDSVASDVVVPSERLFSIVDGMPRSDAALYRFPLFGYFALSIAAAALGNARGAIQDLVELAAGKVGAGSSRTLAERPATQAAVGEAEAELRAARSFYYEAVEEAWAAAQQGEVSVELRLGLRLAATHAVRRSANVARTMYDLGGGTAIYESSPLQRRFRDAHAATAHFQVNPATWELAGRLLVGLPTDTGRL